MSEQDVRITADADDLISDLSIKFRNNLFKDAIAGAKQQKSAAFYTLVTVGDVAEVKYNYAENLAKDICKYLDSSIKYYELADMIYAYMEKTFFKDKTK